MLRSAFKLALRQTEGLITSVLALMGLMLSAPDHSTVSRRSVTLPVIRPVSVPQGPLHVLIDSTGLQVYGAVNGWRRNMARNHDGRGASCIWWLMRPAA